MNKHRGNKVRVLFIAAMLGLIMTGFIFFSTTVLEEVLYILILLALR
ncbi:MAG: hypothetical protein MN733_10755 [Nitrososphaera sp.]|nr:hypothetical protein [Nitrososphaera sp.]